MILKKSTFITCLLTGLLFISTHPGFSQEGDTEQKKYVSRMQIIQNLAAEVDSLRLQNSKLNDSLISSRQDYNAVSQENVRLKKDIQQLEQNLDVALNEKLRSTHTNSVLFIFIFLTGVIVLLALIWLFMKKPAAIAHYQDTRTNLEDDDDDDNDAEKNGVDHQLGRIEKLGSLREKGLLTEEEFNFQKRQILSERH